MAGKVSGVTHPSNLADGDTVTETWFDNVTNSVIGLDGALAQTEPVYVTTTKVTTSNTVTETNVFSYTVPANTLGTGNLVRFKSVGRLTNTDASARTFTVKLYYGTTSINCVVSLIASAGTHPVVIEGSIMADGATGAQTAHLMTHRQSQDITTRQEIQGATSEAFAEDSTGALALKVSITMSAADTTISWASFWTAVELVDVS